jgi:DNA-binding response OmpR family regulator
MKKSVLVIDDESDLCELISMVLEKEGFEVDCALTLAEATEKLLRNPDIILLDNNLPDGTGLEFIQRHLVDFTKSYVVLMSAEPGKDLKSGEKYGVIRAFLLKPFSMVRMKEILKNVA